MPKKPGRVVSPLIGVLVALGLALALTACAGGKAPPVVPGMPDGDKIIENIRQEFELLGDFKGISRYSRVQNGPVQSGRAAFVASPSDKLRVEILSPFGQPIVSLASNGKHIFLYDRSKDRLRSGVPSRNMIERALGAPLSVKELVYILAGFPPVASHHHTEVQPWRLAKGTPEQGYVVILKSRFGNLKEKIWVGRDGKTVKKAALYDGDGAPLYTVIASPGLKGTQMVILGEKELSITLDPQRFWKNEVVEKSRFTIKRPNG